MDKKNKRKVTFHSDVDQNETNKKQKKFPSNMNSNSNNEQSRLHSGDHTLDSDEDNDDQHQHFNDDDDDDELNQDEQCQTKDKDFKEMSENDLQAIGQEKATIGFDDDVKITPFNIDEELEDGQYDQSGCFQWKKKNKDEIRDAWLDEIDWTNVKNYKLKTPQATIEERNEETTNDEEIPQFNRIETIQSMLKIMKPGETVTKTIKRLGTSTENNKKNNSKQRNRRLLPGEIESLEKIEETEEEKKEKKKDLNSIIGLADQFVSQGDLDIYQQTFEMLTIQINQRNNHSNSHLQNSTFDMFDHHIDIQQSITNPTTTTNHNSESSKSDIFWEYKIDDSNEIQGPFTTEEMIDFLNQHRKLDQEKIFCRRIRSEQFYSIKRIDFDLYLD